MKKLCLLCMRGNSKGVKNKNLKKINGVPLLKYTIDQAIKSNLFDKIVISSDSKKIISMGNKFGIKDFILRPKKLATDKSGKLDVLKHALHKIEKIYSQKFDIIFDLDVTSPLRNINDIKESYKLFQNKNASKLITANYARKNPFFNQVMIKNNNVQLVKRSKSVIVRRQSAPKIYDMNASIYIFSRQTLIRSKKIFPKNTIIYLMPEDRSVDIDNKLDFQIVEMLLKKKLKIKN